MPARRAPRRVAEEVPVALMYAGLPHVVMMATPADLEDFALGFSLSEGIVRAPDELLSVEVVPAGEGVQVSMDIPLERYLPLEQQRRNLAGRSSCGLCGAETIDQAVRHPARVGAGVKIAPAALHRAFAALAQRQPLNAITGGVHAAAWASPEGEVLLVREDVGRHNALDKLIGALMRAGYAVDAGFAVITSRASFEMAQKAATVGITRAGGDFRAHGAGHPAGRGNRPDPGRVRARRPPQRLRQPVPDRPIDRRIDHRPRWAESDDAA